VPKLAQIVESHVLLLTPVIATLLAKAGYSKRAVAEYLMKHATVPAHYYEWHMMLGDHHTPGTTIAGLVEEGLLPREWRLSDDPDRLVLLMLREARWLSIVAGDPLRNRSSYTGRISSRAMRRARRWSCRRSGMRLPVGCGRGAGIHKPMNYSRASFVIVAPHRFLTADNGRRLSASACP